MAIDVEEVAIRSGVTADWATAAVLDTGEVGIDLTTGEMRLGDGTSAWAALKSLTPKRSSVTLVAGTKTTADTAIKAGSVVVPVITALGTVTAPKALYVTKSNGVSFTVTSSDNTDTSTVAVLIWY